MKIKIETMDETVISISLSFRPNSELAPEMILDLINSVAQSNSVFSITESLIRTVATITNQSQRMINKE